MCGIAGAIWTKPERAIELPVLERMTSALKHRGPDDQGLYQNGYRVRPPYDAQPGIALGHRRLSIIDLAGGHQPLANEDETVWVVFNGEIYNFVDLRRRLEGSGHKFRTDSDTETIVHLYEDEGPECFAHLAGMFSIAIWDSNRRRLVLGRDRLGKKPLVYRHEAGRLLFASELKSLLQVPGAPRDIDFSAIDEYLTYQYVPHPNTIFRGYKKLPPGHFAVWQDDELQVRPYWQPDFTAEHPCAEIEAVERVRELLNSAVKTRLRSDVPLGAFLSGGIDSSLIVALMQQQAGERVKTFTIGFPIKEYDESPYAERVAKHLGTDHQTLRVDPDAVRVLPQLAYHYDEPFGDSSAVPTWYVSQLTREHVTVALSGDGGDELFAGYPRYRAAALGGWFDRVPMIRSLFAANLWQSLPSSGRQKSRVRQFKRFASSLSLTPERRYLDWISIFNEARRGELYNEDFLAQLPNSDPAGFLLAAWKRTKGRDPISAASLTDLVTYLPCDLMTKVDIASMAHGLEIRAPFLDHRLVEFAAGLPVKFKHRNRRGKWLLKRAFGELLPNEVWQRPKMGFGVPLDHWFRNELRPLVRETLLDGQCTTQWFRREAISELIEDHEQRRFDHSARIWSLLMLELWLREWGGPQIPNLPAPTTSVTEAPSL
ncbi:Asparagine synthetase [glutamine-hydrolyzing] 1 [Anatilimnocola aggregata]|uniref:asparagine synthase (glutamine-hydrolyzing) n=1 Tax=Anatilimnocola aggregata TaxID=2528021 RepID=A0A517Y9T0_9BACT|nr:asparagine synthase (glutamine-hydrolyzing) [Anatilimnocola aggregata]QDU26993.1 Asparagine synthetase [glutamine-hydrolyzing] 1 [Anatilimnocola aggregata]